MYAAVFLLQLNGEPQVFFIPALLEARGEPEGEKIIKAAATSLQLLEVSPQSGLWVVDRPLGGIDTVWLSI